MPTPERRSDRLSSRRSPEQQQLSPFRRRARYDPPFDFDFNTSSDKEGTRHRRNFSQTGTLSGAFATISRGARMSEDPQTATSTRGTPSPGRRKQTNFTFSPQSNPPNELQDIYRRIDDADSLVDFDDQDDIFTTDANYFNEIADESVPEHVRDERRLRRATTSHSPVLSRSGTPLAALTAENLQRRENEEEETQQDVSEDDNNLKPSLNLPSTWGTRATQRPNWMREIGRRSEGEARERKRERKQEENRTASKSPVSKPSQLRTRLQAASSRSPSHSNIASRGTLEERPASEYNRNPPIDEQIKLSPGQQNNETLDGDVIPNTPITIYKNSSFSKRSPTKRDSHTLLRKLSRTESPHQMKTPEGQKVPDRQIYEKTPVVTGAWIDTPMTERPTQPASHLPRDIILPPPEPPTNSERENQWMEPEWTESRHVEPQQKEHQQPESELPTEPQINKKPDFAAPPQKRIPKTRAPLIKPDLPKSGLAHYMQDMKTDKDSNEFGDDTIESLQMILDEQPTETKTDPEDDAAYEKAILEKLQVANSNAKENVADSDLPKQTEKLFDQVNDQLKTLVNNINRTSKGLDKLEDRLARENVFPSHHAGENCTECGAHSNSQMSASFTLPRFWARDPVSRRIRLTLLGWCTIVPLLWFWSESTMCDYYCHPVVARVCNGNCLRPDAPRFPFVIPTMLWRWSHLSAIMAPAITMAVAFFRLIAQLLGFWDGYVDDAPRAVNLSGEIRIHGKRVTEFPTATAGSRAFLGQKHGQEQAQRRYQEPVPELKIGQSEPSIDDDEYL